MERRLAAILAADVVGYSALMERDEAGTFELLRSSRKELFEPEIERRRGRIFKLMGDGLLAEFASVVDAVECAVALQAGLANRYRSFPEAGRIHLRIGINLGEVIVEGDDRFGDGVNVAARLEQLAKPGEIYVSGKVAKEVERRLPFNLEPVGERRLKNLAELVMVYRVKPGEGAPVFGRYLLAKRVTSRKTLAIGLALFLAAALAAGAWWKPWESRFKPDLPLPNKPSVAVLPFLNMSADPGQAYFADGMTENLITDLSQIPGLFVIARNSTFAYKDKPIDPRQAASELGVRYVLEGSVQRSTDAVRINAQLIDAVTGGHVWASRFDGSLADVFAVQDKVTRSIAAALALRLSEGSQDTVIKSETTNPAAYDFFLRGLEHMRRMTPQEFSKAIPYFEKALSLDPEYGQAHAALAWIYVAGYQRRWFDVLKISDIEARIRAKRYLAEAMKRPSSLAHQAAGEMLTAGDGDYRRAVSEFKEAIVLDPGNAVSYISMADVLTMVGRAEEALPLISTAMRLDPLHPPFFNTSLGMAQYKLERFNEAAAAFEEAARLDPEDATPALWLVATYGSLNRPGDAKTALARYDKLMVGRGGMPAALDTTTSRVREGLILAGISNTLGESEFALANRMQPADIRQLLLGHRLHGRNIRTGTEHGASIAADGAASLWGDWAIFSSGTITIGDIETCITWPNGEKSCGGVSRNPGGTKSRANEFIWFLHQGPMSFSKTD